MRKLFIAALMSIAVTTWAADEPEKYQATCSACHAMGVANAPKTGDAAGWEPRLAKGMDVLVASVKNGMGAMPPTGLCGGCSDAEYKALIEFMAAPAK